MILVKPIKQLGETSPMHTPGKLIRILRSIGAVLIGLIAITILSIGTDLIVHATGIYPPWGQPMSDSSLISIPCGWLGGKLNSMRSR